jgi:hypothetical protein
MYVSSLRELIHFVYGQYVKKMSLFRLCVLFMDMDTFWAYRFNEKQLCVSVVCSHQ